MADNEAVDPVETGQTGATGKPRAHEDSVRFMRQLLLALEEGRDDDVLAIADFIASEFGERILVRQTSDLAGTPEGAAYLARWRVPERAERVVVMLDRAREPIWRIPNAEFAQSDETRAAIEAFEVEYGRKPGLHEVPNEMLVLTPGGFETPLHMLPGDPITGEKFVGANAPTHLQPRKAGDLPAGVASAIRPWRG